MKKFGEIFGWITAGVLGIVIAVGLIFLIMCIEALIIWGVISLACLVAGIGFVTFGQCLAGVIFVNLLAWIIRKTFSAFNKD